VGFHKIVVQNILRAFTLDIDGPTLVRVNRMIQTSGAPVFAPTTGGFIWLAAWPFQEQPPGSSQNEQEAKAWRGTGPLIYLPFRGKWSVTLDISSLGGALLPGFNRAELSLIEMPPEVAAAYLQTPPASYHVSGNFTVAAGAGFNVWSASGIDLSFSPPAGDSAFWHNVVRFAINMNTSPMTDFKVAVGRTAAAAVGSTLTGFGRRVFEWQEIAGQTIFVFNNTAGAADVCVEAHFL
jgi:hypothetical protein